MLALKVRQIVLSTLLIVATAQSASAQTASRFDGRWSVVIVTEAGTCDRAYRYGLRIAGGRIYYDGGGVELSGRVDQAGRVFVSLRSGESAARAAGRLSRFSGSGRWQGTSPAMRCSGRWQAERG